MDAYPSVEDLEIMVYEELNENLNAIAGGGNLKGVVFNLIRWAEASGKLNQLIEGASQGNPYNPRLQAIKNELFTHEDNKRTEVTSIEPEKSITFGRNINGRNKQLIINDRERQNQHFTEDLGNGIEIEMLYIPGGNFTMGAPNNEQGSSNNERPQHQVRVPTFFMGKYPVTQAQWRAVTFITKVNRELNPDPSYFKGDNRPVESISWFDAVEFCQRLSQYTNKNYRLPSEAEWEYACRARSTTPFYFGETITSDLVNHDGNYKRTTDVGSLGRANAFGLYDMHGNVWEWCADQWHENYTGAPTDGSAWIDTSDNDNHCRLLRGGSWNLIPESCRCAYRYYNNPEVVFDGRGLRVVCGVLP